MKIGSHNTDTDILVIAEIGNNHEGSYTLAEELIGKAKDAGVGAVKFQTFLAERYVSPRNKERFERLQKFQLTYEQFEQLAAITKKAGLLFISTPFDIESARFLGNIVDAIKIASADNTFYPLIEEIAQTGKPTLLSTGLAGLQEINLAKSLIEETWRKGDVYTDLAVLHCVSSYPVPANEANLAAINTLRAELNCTIGYSDHVVGNDAAVLAVAMGARIIEKHFTIDNNYSEFRDHQLSANPATLADLVKRIEDTRTMLGNGVVSMADCEAAEASAIRRSITAASDLKSGTTLNSDHITWVRPGDGLPPGQEHLVLGRTLNADLHLGDLITPDVLK